MPTPEELHEAADRLAPLLQSAFPGYALSVEEAEGRIEVTLPPHCLSDWEVERGEQRITAESAVPVAFDSSAWDFDDPPWSCGAVRDDWPVALLPASVAYDAALLEGMLRLEDGCLAVDGTAIILPYRARSGTARNRSSPMSSQGTNTASGITSPWAGAVACWSTGTTRRG